MEPSKLDNYVVIEPEEDGDDEDQFRDCEIDVNIPPGHVIGRVIRVPPDCGKWVRVGDRVMFRKDHSFREVVSGHYYADYRDLVYVLGEKEGDNKDDNDDTTLEKNTNDAGLPAEKEDEGCQKRLSKSPEGLECIEKQK